MSTADLKLFNEFPTNQTEIQISQPPVDQELMNLSSNQHETDKTAARLPQINQRLPVDQSSKNILTVNQLPTNQHHFHNGLEAGQSATEGIIKYSVVHT